MSGMRQEKTKKNTLDNPKEDLSEDTFIDDSELETNPHGTQTIHKDAIAELIFRLGNQLEELGKNLQEQNESIIPKAPTTKPQPELTKVFQDTQINDSLNPKTKIPILEKKINNFISPQNQNNIKT